jgi:hypothetical protein
VRLKYKRLLVARSRLQSYHRRTTSRIQRDYQDSGNMQISQFLLFAIAVATGTSANPAPANANIATTTVEAAVGCRVGYNYCGWYLKKLGGRSNVETYHGPH